MKQRRIDPILIARMEGLGLYVFSANQPPRLFRGPRKLANVPQDDDPWFVSLYRKGLSCWEDGACVSSAVGDTLDDAVSAAIPTGVRAALLRLEYAISRLTGVFRAG